MLGCIFSAIEGLKNSNLRKNLNSFDPNRKKTSASFQSTLNVNITYITKHIKRLMPYEGAIEISVCSFVTKHKKRDPFLVHDILHSIAKYLSTQTKATFKISYQKDFLIKRMELSGKHIKLEKEKDEILALCIHWFIWQYSSDPYKLDQSFKQIPVSTNLIYGKMYGYHDEKEYDCKIECWESYTPTFEYSNGRTKGIEFDVKRSKTKTVYIYPARNQKIQNEEIEICRKINESLILEKKLTQNPFYHVVPDLLGKLCFSNDSRIERNLIPPSDARDEWGNNFDAWFFVYSVFITFRILRKNYVDHILNLYKKEFLSDYDKLKISFSDINFDHYSFDAVTDHKDLLNVGSIGYGEFYNKLESYMESKLKDIFSDLKDNSVSHDKIQYTSFLALWNYLLFGSYNYISNWNRLTANSAINIAIHECPVVTRTNSIG
jgi:hypothetical protein